ncbi:2OG-Fe(II) oxygenase superfamily protein [Drepanopeziza brunnea f. sp. 'multigermtubi' MB_m1]|uniref:2OG-Fe(II) oxygenase superfamily protein n=1 Tax=Marssonina brunnea f. sp. multigermtubi (strain MB_m1) TaxID=1072389 RepID=K1WW74_MARBU|nr:2OG-Fe(II) oxygenase superfamily protein [Drepanopeziza brunnea f. sp. 'multigermtubi' MB_m1]EKD12943.1 2OG-Fe(II) oxygenase superfamily protein [Drepanopeziza brunnea f. sp. 'multigermtubi' MB_m1]
MAHGPWAPRRSQADGKRSKHNFTRSTVTDGSGVQGPSQTRTSQSTTVTRDSVIRCMESRAASFQGLHISRSHLEPLQLVQYGSGENYRVHTDWLSAPCQITSDVGGNRLSSFFAYVAASDLTGGGTNFPMLDTPYSERWCAFIDCDEPWDNGEWQFSYVAFWAAGDKWLEAGDEHLDTGRSVR